MTAFNMGRAGPPERWNQNCRANGEDYGCDHLRCKSESWIRAMDRMGHDVTPWQRSKSKSKPKPKIVKAIGKADSFKGSDVSQPRQQHAGQDKRSHAVPEPDGRRTRSQKKVDFMV